MRTNHLTRSFLSRKPLPITREIRGGSLPPMDPSDHNAVLAEDTSHTERKRWAKKKHRKPRERQEDWEVYDDDPMHGLAFLVPVPLIYGSGFPSGPDGKYGGVSPYLLFTHPPNPRELGWVRKQDARRGLCVAGERI